MNISSLVKYPTSSWQILILLNDFTSIQKLSDLERTDIYDNIYELQQTTTYEGDRWIQVLKLLRNEIHKIRIPAKMFLDIFDFFKVLTYEEVVTIFDHSQNYYYDLKEKWLLCLMQNLIKDADISDEALAKLSNSFSQTLDTAVTKNIFFSVEGNVSFKQLEEILMFI